MNVKFDWKSAKIVKKNGKFIVRVHCWTEDGFSAVSDFTFILDGSAKKFLEMRKENATN